MLLIRCDWLFEAEVAAGAEVGVVTEAGVVVEDGKVAACGEFQLLRERFGSAEILDLSGCVVLPGLINAHTHLELSGLREQVAYEGDFVDWVDRLGQARRQGKKLGQWDLEEVVQQACVESLRSGVTTVGDVCFGHRVWQMLAQQKIRKVCFAEVFGLGDDLDEQRDYLNKCIEQTQPDELLTLGLSPHAPYSAQSGVYRLAAQLGREHGLALTTHLAETMEEIEFLVSGEGPWRNYLKKMFNWDGDFERPGKMPVEYFLEMELAEQDFLLAHVNYITFDELELLRGRGHSVAYCPRSHNFFGHPVHPFQKMLELGINVCLGTDSLASNSSLSILDEMRFLRREFPDLDVGAILRMATINGAKALQLDDKIGSIRVGKEADLIALPLVKKAADYGSNGAGVLEEVLDSEILPGMVMVRGEIVRQD
ncbi:MAG: amidohydrolase family protein [Sedimentisphaerales bacterium]|nr:amidohydrolase family protein [Sedimentisphaerales bacterium]